MAQDEGKKGFGRFLVEHAGKVLIGVFLLGLLLVYSQVANDPEHKSVFFIMVGHLGMALLIAALLGLTIEQFTKLRHEQHRDALVQALNKNREETIDDLQKHVLRAVYRRTLPSELIDSAEAAIFQASFLRRNWKVHFELNRLPDEARTRIGERVVRLRTTFSYDVENVSKTTRELIVPVVIDMASSYYDPNLCGLRVVEIQGKVLQPLELDELKDSDAGSSSCALKIRKDMLPGNVISLRLVYEQLQPEESVEFLCTVLPATTMTVTAITPDSNFDLKLVSLHQAEPKLVHESEAMCEWTLGPALFPGHGVALIWRPRLQKPLI